MDGEAGKSAELRWATDRAIRVAFGETASPEAHASVRALTETLNRAPIPGMLSAQPSHLSVLVVVDPLAALPEVFERRLRAVVAGLRLDDLLPTRLVEIPVLYGGEHGPDLDDVARITGLSPEEVVGLHASAEYTVAFLGFVPGFAYLSGLPEVLRLPRLPSPRRRVAPGSVGVAGGQTAVYPLATPGGWRLIGRTNTTLFRPDREPPALLAAGDRVRFVRVDAVAFARTPRGTAQ